MGLYDKIRIGVDIERIDRFKKYNYQQYKKFYQRVFNENEIKYCLSKEPSHQHFAVRYCAKEAFIKAMNRKIRDFRDVSIMMDNKKPYILWNNRKYLLSLSHSSDMAIAFVVVKNET